MTRRVLILLAAFGSAALLLGAFGFQHIGGMAPCKLCLWQRWPHAAAMVLGILAISLGSRVICWLGALATLSTAGIGLYHAGVEWGFWPGPSSCSGSGADLGALDGAALLSLDTPVSVVMCDEIVWQLFGLSMAGWNAIVALGLTVLWVMAARKPG